MIRFGAHTDTVTHLLVVSLKRLKERSLLKPVKEGRRIPPSLMLVVQTEKVFPFSHSLHFNIKVVSFTQKKTHFSLTLLLFSGFMIFCFSLCSERYLGFSPPFLLFIETSFRGVEETVRRWMS